MSSATAGLLDRVRPTRETMLWIAIVVNLEMLALALYWLSSGARLSGPLGFRFWVYPWVWINVGVLAVLRTDHAPAPLRTRAGAGLLAVGYFIVLGYFGGVFGTAGPGPVSVRVAAFGIPPGWGPAVLYNGVFLSGNLLPFKLVGYGALSYLVYATVVDASGSAVTGLLGLFSCISCTFPVVVTVFTGLFGGGAALAAAVYSRSYDLSTLVFVVTVALLYWRPFGR